MAQEAKRDEPPPPPSYDLESNMSSMSDSNIGFRPVARQRSESQLPPHWSRRATPPQTRPIEKVRSTTMRFLDKITRSSSTLDPDVTRTASCKDKQMIRKDKQRLVDRLDAFSQSRGKIRIVRQHVSNRLAYRDVFHSIVEAPLRKIIPGLTLLYLVNCVFFALLWWAASKDCDVGIRTSSADIKLARRAPDSLVDCAQVTSTTRSSFPPSRS